MRFASLARSASKHMAHDDSRLPPLGQRIAVASDRAFGFPIPISLMAGGVPARASCLSRPLADEPPDRGADAVYLPGGYPELHAGRLAANTLFLDGVRAAASRDAVIYGECGGYMALGDRLIDGNGVRHAMAGLLPLESSFATRKLHLGYRNIRQTESGPFGAAGTRPSRARVPLRVGNQRRARRCIVRLRGCKRQSATAGRPSARPDDGLISACHRRRLRRVSGALRLRYLQALDRVAGEPADRQPEKHIRDEGRTDESGGYFGRHGPVRAFQVRRADCVRQDNQEDANRSRNMARHKNDQG